VTPTVAGWSGAAATRRIDVVIPADVRSFANLTISPVGDLNGDGFADFVIGSVRDRRAGVGRGGVCLPRLGRAEREIGGTARRPGSASPIRTGPQRRSAGRRPGWATSTATATPTS
jgi:hypothetical protein